MLLPQVEYTILYFDEGALFDLRWRELVMEQKQRSCWAVQPGHVSGATPLLNHCRHFYRRQSKPVFVLKLWRINPEVWSTGLQEPMGQSSLHRTEGWRASAWSNFRRAFQKKSSPTEPVYPERKEVHPFYYKKIMFSTQNCVWQKKRKSSSG